MGGAGLAVAGTGVVLAAALLAGPAWVVRSTEQDLEVTATAALGAAGIKGRVRYSGFDAQITVDPAAAEQARQVVAQVSGTRAVVVTAPGAGQTASASPSASAPSPVTTPSPVVSTGSGTPAPAASSATPTPSPQRPDLAPIVFEGASAALSAESRERLTQLAQYLLAHPAVRVEIVGYTDNGQDAEGRRRLSLARAEAVRLVLVSAGVPRERTSTLARGSADPAASNDTPEGRAQNRRVEIQLREG